MTRISPPGNRLERLPTWVNGSKSIFSSLLVLGIILTGVTPARTADFIPLEEISRGMTGFGLTVFEGSRIDTFTVTVIGVQEKVRAAGSLILVEVAGHGLEKSSIAQGMSGSPVFIDGRFAGALAFGWGGALRPLAGVTPAGDILNLPTDMGHLAVSGNENRLNGWSDAGLVMDQLLPHRQGADLAAAVLGEDLPKRGANASGVNREGWPSSEELILSLMEDVFGSGPDDHKLQPENWFISPLGFSGQGVAGVATGELPTLRPGSSCAVPLVTGDAQLGAIGTVTWVEGDDVFMMGHPFMQRGPVNLPLATAEILTVFPSRQLSFKLGAVGRIVGTVHHDQRAGLSGRLGASPTLIPVELDLVLPGSDPNQANQHQYNFEVVDDPQLTPTLVFWTLYNSLLVEGDDASRQNLKFSIELDWDGPGSLADQPLVMTGVTAGPGGVGRLATEWMAPISILLNNPYAEVRLKAVRARFEVSRPVASATVTGVTVPRLVASAGQEIKCRVEITPRLGLPRMVEVPVDLPVDLEPGNYRLAVASAAEMFALEAQRAAGRFQVNSLESILEILRTERAASTLVVALFSPGKAVVLQGREMASLPDRVARVIRSGNMGTSSTMADFVARRELSTEWLLQGHAVRNIEVAPRAKSVQQERRP